MTDQERFDFLHAFLSYVRVDYDPATKKHTLKPYLALENGEGAPVPKTVQPLLRAAN